MCSALLEIYTCCFLGEETFYRRHIQRLALNSNTDAQELLQSEDRHNTELKTITDKLEYLKTIGFEGIYNVCVRVTGQDDFVFAQNRTWSLCALSGETHNNFIVVSGEHNGQFLTFNIHEKFRGFLEALWLVFHVQRVQNLRIKDWFLKLSPKQQKMSPALLIQTFTAAKKKETTVVLDVVKSAFSLVHHVLDDTTQKIENSDWSMLSI